MKTLHDKQVNYINSVVNSILVLPSDTRIAIAQCLLVELEEKKDITRWNFWERQSVKEHSEEIAEEELSEEQVDQIMDNLNTEWNHVSVSVNGTDDFTDALDRAIRKNNA